MRFSLIPILLLLTATTIAQVPSYVPTDGLAGWWPFNGNANDESGNGNHGTANGALLTLDRDGNANSAYNLNGLNQNIDGTIGGLFTTIETTVSAWVNYTGDAGGQPYDTYFQLGTYGNHSFAYGYDYSGQNLNYYAPCTAIPSLIDADLNNAWHLITMVDSEAGSTVYIDGQPHLEGTGGIQGNCYQGSSFFQIGGGSDNQWVTGDIDDVGYWNRALTQQEVTSLYTGSGVGIPNASKSYPGFRIFPNPSDGLFAVQLELQGGVSIQMFDATGRLTHSESFQASGSPSLHKLDLTKLAEGCYTLQAAYMGTRLTQTVIIN